MAEHSNTTTRKDRIMAAALRIFAAKGFQNATIAEISREAGVSEPTIYEYFGTKEALLFAIPEKVSNDSHENTRRMLPRIKGVEGKIRAILYGYFNLYQTNPDYSALVLLQLMSNTRFRQTEAHAAIRRSSRNLLECIREGMMDGTFKQDADPYLIRSILLGTIEHLFIQKHMQNRMCAKADPLQNSNTCGKKVETIDPEKKMTLKNKSGEDMSFKNMMDYLDPIMETVLDGIRVRSSSEVTFRMDVNDAVRLQKLFRVARNRKEGKATLKKQNERAKLAK